MNYRPARTQVDSGSEKQLNPSTVKSQNLNRVSITEERTDKNTIIPVRATSTLTVLVPKLPKRSSNVKECALCESRQRKRDIPKVRSLFGDQNERSSKRAMNIPQSDGEPDYSDML